MPKSENQKLKLIYLMKIFLEKTDEEHTLTVNDLIGELERLDIAAERKTIYDDIDELRQYGLDIVRRKSKTFDYFVASKTFELAELKLLVDAVQASKFITIKKSNELIKKLESCASIYEARQLQRHVFVSNRVKTMNESIYYNVDKLHTAISEKKQISFKYFEYTIDKQKSFRKNGENYITNPCALSWDDENYYLITYNEKYKDLVHYRVDKMTNIEMTDTPAELPNSKEFDVADYAKKVFNMYGGEEQDVSLQFDNSLIGVVIDRFGKDVFVNKIDEQHFGIRLKIVVSPTFLAWLFQFGSQVKILSPISLIDQIKAKATEVLGQYE